MVYGYRCDHGDGIVREKIVKREAFKHKDGFVILENVPIGVCDGCGMRYFHASLLKRVAAVANGTIHAERTEPVPVAHAM